MKYKDPITGELKEIYTTPGGDTAPIGTILEIEDTAEIPYGYELVTNYIKDEDISSTKEAGVVDVTRARVLSSGNIHFIDIACSVSNGSVSQILFTIPYKPPFTMEINAITNSNLSARAIVNTNGTVQIAPLSGSAGSQVVYLNGMVIA